MSSPCSKLRTEKENHRNLKKNPTIIKQEKGKSIPEIQTLYMHLNDFVFYPQQKICLSIFRERGRETENLDVRDKHPLVASECALTVTGCSQEGGPQIGICNGVQNSRCPGNIRNIYIGCPHHKPELGEGTHGAGPFRAVLYSNSCAANLWHGPLTYL